MESVVWDIEAPSFLCYILSNIINRVWSMKGWLCNWEKPSTSQPRHSVMHLHCVHNPCCISLECLLHVEDRKLLLIPAEGAATVAQVTKAYTPWSHRSHACFSLRTQPQPFSAADLMLLMPYTVVMLLVDVVATLEKWWLSAKWSWWKRRPHVCSASWSLGAQVGSVLAPCWKLNQAWSVSHVCPVSSGKEGAMGHFVRSHGIDKLQTWGRDLTMLNH